MCDTHTDSLNLLKTANRPQFLNFMCSESFQLLVCFALRPPDQRLLLPLDPAGGSPQTLRINSPKA